MRINNTSQIEGLSSFLTSVFGITALGILATGVIIALVGPILLHYIHSLTYVMIIGVIINLVLNIVIQSYLLRFQLTTLIALLGALTISNGILYSFVYIVGYYYGFGIVISALVGTLVIFTASSLYGLFSNRDLSSLGGILQVMGFSFLGLFLLRMILSFISPAMADSLSLITAGLSMVFSTIFVAYEVDKMKNLYCSFRGDGNFLSRIVLIGSLNLYNSFVNLFLNLLYLLMRLKERK